MAMFDFLKKSANIEADKSQLNSSEKNQSQKQWFEELKSDLSDNMGIPKEKLFAPTDYEYFKHQRIIVKLIKFKNLTIKVLIIISVAILAFLMYWILK